MATNTTNYNWTKPDYEDDADIKDLNDNFDDIDAQVKAIDDQVQLNKNNILSKATSILIDEGNRNITSITYDISDYTGKFLQLATTRTADGATIYGTSVYILRINSSLDVEQFTPIHEENNAKITGISISDGIATITYDVIGYHITRAVVF